MSSVIARVSQHLSKLRSGSSQDASKKEKPSVPCLCSVLPVIYKTPRRLPADILGEVPLSSSSIAARKRNTSRVLSAKYVHSRETRVTCIAQTVLDFLSVRIFKDLALEAPDGWGYGYLANAAVDAESKIEVSLSKTQQLTTYWDKLLHHHDETMGPFASYRSLFDEAAILVSETLSRGGFAVLQLNIRANETGVYVWYKVAPKTNCVLKLETP